MASFFPSITQSPWPNSQDGSEGLEGRCTASSTLEMKPAPSPSPGGGGVLCQHLISGSTVTHSWDPGETQP